jgi:hypothetical protein
MHSLTDLFLRTPFHWWIALISCAVGLAAICTRALRTGQWRAKRTERNKKKELRHWLREFQGMGTVFINVIPLEMSSSARET